MKILKLFFIALITAVPIFSNAQTGDDMKSVFVDAHTWTTSIKMGWNLGNALECQTGWNDKAFCWNPANNFNAETSWGNPKTTKEMLQAVREAVLDSGLRYGAYRLLRLVVLRIFLRQHILP